MAFLRCDAFRALGNVFGGILDWGMVSDGIIEDNFRAGTRTAPSPSLRPVRPQVRR